jgi:hypothetical protein
VATIILLFELACIVPVLPIANTFVTPEFEVIELPNIVTFEEEADADVVFEEPTTKA